MRSGSSGAATAAVATLTLLLTGCGSTPRPTAGVGRPTGGKVVDYPVKVGAPYQVGGITYMPVDDPDYDAVGMASWYGGEFGGSPTANGERFDPGRMSAAHKTLPLPSCKLPRVSPSPEACSADLKPYHGWAWQAPTG